LKGQKLNFWRFSLNSRLYYKYFNINELTENISLSVASYQINKDDHKKS